MRSCLTILMFEWTPNICNCLLFRVPYHYKPFFPCRNMSPFSENHKLVLSRFTVKPNDFEAFSRLSGFVSLLVWMILIRCRLQITVRTVPQAHGLVFSNKVCNFRYKEGKHEWTEKTPLFHYKRAWEKLGKLCTPPDAWLDWTILCLIHIYRFWQCFQLF